MFFDSESPWCRYHGGSPRACCGACCASPPVRRCPTQRSPATATRRRSGGSRSSFAASFAFAAAVSGRWPEAAEPSIGRLLPAAPSPIDLIRALAHPFLEASGANIRPTIAVFAGSNNASDERMLLPVPIFARQNRGPYNFSDDSIIEYPRSDGRVCEQGLFVCMQISGNPRKTIFGQIMGK